MTNQINIEIEPQFIDEKFVAFMTNNIRANPGKTQVRFNIIDEQLQKKLSLYTFDKGLLLNDDIIEFLNRNPNVSVSVSMLQ
jgi:DNA polymerase-3 subunit alpha